MEEATDFMPSQEQLNDLVKLGRIFLPSTYAAIDARYPGAGGSARFAHYTSAEAALNIIRTKRLWMRSTTCMADYNEVEHGCEIVNRVFAGDYFTRFEEALGRCAPGAAKSAAAMFNDWLQDIRGGAFISCVSEHSDREDFNGRLSMWRAVGASSNRVAIVASIPWFTGTAITLKLAFGPVSYVGESEVAAEFDEVLANIRANCTFLAEMGAKWVGFSAFNMLINRVTCLKHEGFAEEKEWRLVYLPRRSPSPLIQCDIESIAGVPQPVYKIPFDATVSQLLDPLDFATIFDRLIIGPTDYPLAMFDAFARALEDAGVPDARSRVVASKIPIRA